MIVDGAIPSLKSAKRQLDGLANRDRWVVWCLCKDGIGPALGEIPGTAVFGDARRNRLRECTLPNDTIHRESLAASSVRWPPKTYVNCCQDGA